MKVFRDKVGLSSVTFHTKRSRHAFISSVTTVSMTDYFRVECCPSSLKNKKNKIKRRLTVCSQEVIMAQSTPGVKEDSLCRIKFGILHIM